MSIQPLRDFTALSTLMPKFPPTVILPILNLLRLQSHHQIDVMTQIWCLQSNVNVKIFLTLICATFTALVWMRINEISETGIGGGEILTLVRGSDRSNTSNSEQFAKLYSLHKFYSLHYICNLAEINVSYLCSFTPFVCSPEDTYINYWMRALSHSSQCRSPTQPIKQHTHAFGASTSMAF